MNFIDYLAIAAYFAAVAVIVLRAAKKQTSTEEYFVAGRRIPAFAVGLSMMATTISSTSFVALPGSVFARNWWQMLYMSMALAVLPFVMIFAVPFYRRVVGLSAYEYLERRFGYGARVYGSIGFLILRLADIGFTFFTTAVALEVITGWNINAVVIVVGVFTLFYTFLGGLTGSIWTSMMQGAIYVGAALLVLGVILISSGQGPLGVIATAHQGGKFSLGSFELSWNSLFQKDATAWIWIVAGIMYFGRYYTTEQNMVQRYLSASSDRQAQRGLLLGIAVTVPVWFTFAFIGACLWGFYSLQSGGLPADVVNRPDNVLPYFVVSELPRGLIGLVVAGLFSSAMGSSSADLNSVAAIATQDYYCRLFPRSSDRQRLAFGRVAVVLAGFVPTSVALGLTLTRSTAVYEIVALAASIVAGGTLGLFALGFFTRSATRRGANTGIAVCLAFVAWATLTGPMRIDLGFNYTMNPILIGAISHFVLFIAGYAASRLAGGPRGDLAGLTVHTRKAASGAKP
jgi:SSS family solute:Na+ symporter